MDEPMKLVTIQTETGSRLGIATDEGILQLDKALGLLPDSEVPRTAEEAIAGGTAAIEKLAAYAARLSEQSTETKAAVWAAPSDLVFGPCVPNPSKIICVGLNYRKHAEETNAPIPQYPILFNKFNNTLNGHLGDVPLPKVSSKVDYEAELVVVIGSAAKYVSKDEALNHVFGYCAVNDVSARDLQLRTQQWLLGKSCDGFSPLGPYLVSADEVGDPNQLEIKLTLNGEVRQHSNTSDMIFYVDEIVSYISQHMTLLPGDIILTGTPEGVVLGLPEDQQVWLKDGDVVTVEIEKLGSLTNRFVSEV